MLSMLVSESIAAAEFGVCAALEPKSRVDFMRRCEELAAQYEYIKIEATAADRHKVYGCPKGFREAQQSPQLLKAGNLKS